jgi:hypothetical protein
VCHRLQIGKFFDVESTFVGSSCHCCFVCIKLHSEEGCKSCQEFLSVFFPPKVTLKLSKSVSEELKEALVDLFQAMDITQVRVENDLAVTIGSFCSDFTRMVDEVKSASDIERIWHVHTKIARGVFAILEEVLFGDGEPSDPVQNESSEDSGGEEDNFDEAPNSTDDETYGFEELEMYDD